MKPSPWLALAVTIAVLGTADPAAAQQKHQWKFVSIIPAGQDVFVDRFKELAREITKQTRGQVEVAFYAAGELPYKAPEHLRITGRGLVEMSEVVASMGFGDAPPLVLSDLPYLALNDAERKILRGVMWPKVYEALRKQNVEAISWGAYPPRNIVLRSPAKGLEDLKGRKIRTAGGLEAEYVKLWGAAPSFVVWAEVYPAAQRGIVDGVLTAAVAIETAKLYEVAPYFLKIDGPVAHFFVTVNKEVWGRLSPDLQKTVKAVGDAWSERWQKLVVEDADNGAIKRMLDRGQIKSVVQVPVSAQAETRKGLIPVFRSYLKEKVGADGSAALEQALHELKLP
ncbi:MAG: TRAP transporter substrate-binding protein DctP [Candidatus Rokubacteria bacterium]|nr:TRAP transporter substrate-binding protein DctP [Candidatus Rokubacteria bacterium]